MLVLRLQPLKRSHTILPSLYWRKEEFWMKWKGIYWFRRFNDKIETICGIWSNSQNKHKNHHIVHKTPDNIHKWEHLQLPPLWNHCREPNLSLPLLCKQLHNDQNLLSFLDEDKKHEVDIVEWHFYSQLLHESSRLFITLSNPNLLIHLYRNCILGDCVGLRIDQKSIHTNTKNHREWVKNWISITNSF